MSDANGRDELRAAILQVFGEVYARQGTDVAAPALRDDSVLLESGLDSLGFAILVTCLDEKLGYDPFSISTEPYYPRTFGEFVDFYFKNRPNDSV